MTHPSGVIYPATSFIVRGLNDRTADLLRYWLVFSACLGLLVFRGWDRVAHPELFAEGVRFVGNVLNEGWPGLLQLHDSYFHVAPKLVAVLGLNLVPVSHIPLFTNLACYAVAAAVMASVSRPCYRWIIPADTARIALSLLLVLAPGMVEILGNLAGLHWFLLLWLGLLTLKDPKYPLTVWELALAALTCMSSAGAVVFLPLAFLRLLLARGRHTSTPYQPGLGLQRINGETILFTALFLTATYLMSNFLLQEEKVAQEGIDIVGAARGLDVLLPWLGALFTTFYFLHPFLGTQNTSLFLVEMPFYPLVFLSLALVGLLLCRLKRELDYRFWLVPAWLGCLFLLAIMLSIVRYWSFYGIFSYPYWDWWTRYNFIFGSTGLIFWFVLLRPRNLHRINHWSTALALVLVIGYTSQAGTITTRAQPPHDTDGFFIERYGKKRYWSKTDGQLEMSMQTGCPREVEVAGHPGGKWKFIYKSPLEPDDCPDDSPPKVPEAQYIPPHL